MSFYRIATDGTRTPAAHLVNSFAGPTRTACWLIGGGPSLADVDCAALQASPAPKFAINLNGHGLIRPDFWTYYDTTNRFHRSTFLNPSVMKFVHRTYWDNVIPRTTQKVCDAPNLYFFDRDQKRGFHDFVGVQPSGCCKGKTAGIVDWNDSLVQAIDIAYRLGFRTLYAVGCDMHIRPSAEQLAAAQAVGVEYVTREPLRDFLARWEHAGTPRDQIDALTNPRQYHFDERKPAGAALNTDLHYFRVAQYLRLSQRSMALAGLDLISCTPGSRLNDFFEFETVTTAIRKIHRTTGNPLEEQTRGRYTLLNAQEHPGPVAPMRDYKPHRWPAEKPAPVPQQPQAIPKEIPIPAAR